MKNDGQALREHVYREIVRRLILIDDGTGRRTRYYFAAIFIQENTRVPAYSSREVETLWRRWVAETPAAVPAGLDATEDKSVELSREEAPSRNG